MPVKFRIRRTNRIAAAAAPDTLDAVWERDGAFVLQAKPTIRFALSNTVPSVAAGADIEMAAAARPVAGTFTSAVQLNRSVNIYRGRLFRSYARPIYRKFRVVDYHHMPL